ncbi:MAG: PIN domain-containing protein [Scytonema sp. PMC 1069.18]|nr:PIN domain-containing protein [Scytonema sp. PMC 1069.18]MEC4881017.1 PIN domain-containing protein [Scytonema sp. PMC 1070.18]
MDTYVVDTHALAWFVSEDKRLSPKAEQILSQAEAGEAQVLIPTLVLAELTHIAQKKRVAVTIEELLEKINKGDGFTIVSFDFSIFQTMLQLPENWDIHDRIIAATASYYQATLITRDDMLRDSSEVKTVWD